MIKLQRLILESKPVKTLTNWSRYIILPGFEGVPLYDVIAFSFDQSREIRLNERAASISFNFLLAIPPLFIFIFTLLSYLPGSRRLYAEVLILIDNVVPDAYTFNMIKKVTDDFFEAGTGTLSFGLVLAIYFSSNATLTIMRTFRKSMLHIQVEDRNFIQIRWSAIRLTFIIVFLVLATILIMLTQTIVLNWIFANFKLNGEYVDFIFGVAHFMVTFFLIFFSIGLIYRYAPHVQRKWKIRSPGTILSTILIMSFTYLFSYWVNNIASYNKVYGSLGSILILMFLVFVNSLVLLIGFELNVSIKSLQSKAEQRKI
jgi:membrane protein